MGRYVCYFADQIHRVPPGGSHQTCEVIAKTEVESTSFLSHAAMEQQDTWVFSVVMLLLVFRLFARVFLSLV